MYRFVLGSLVVLASIAPNATARAQTVRRGEITFTQGGQEATWSLARVDVRNTGGLQTTLLYTPDGTAPSSSAPRLDLVYHESGETVTLITLAVKQGPAGDGIFRSGKAVCTLHVSHWWAFVIEGTGTCTGRFEGATVSKLKFSIRRVRPGPV